MDYDFHLAKAYLLFLETRYAALSHRDRLLRDQLASLQSSSSARFESAPSTESLADRPDHAYATESFLSVADRPTTHHAYAAESFPSIESLADRPTTHHAYAAESFPSIESLADPLMIHHAHATESFPSIESLADRLTTHQAHATESFPPIESSADRLTTNQTHATESFPPIDSLADRLTTNQTHATESSPSIESLADRLTTDQTHATDSLPSIDSLADCPTTHQAQPTELLPSIDSLADRLTTHQARATDSFPSIGSLADRPTTHQAHATESILSVADHPGMTTQQAEAEDDGLPYTGMKTTELGVTIIDSLCMQCHEIGETKLLMTSVPFFKEIVISSFACPHCAFRETSVQPGGVVQDRGVKIAFKMNGLKDFSRQLIKSDSCTIRVVELDFEIPAARGMVTNMEGLLAETRDSLQSTQPARVLRDGQEAADQVGKFIERLNDALEGKSFPMTVEFDDPAGNSYVDNPKAPLPDPKLRTIRYFRSKEQTEMLGLQSDVDVNHIAEYKTGANLADANESELLKSRFTSEEVMQIPTFCPNCKQEGTSDTCVVTLPFFKEVIVMAFMCEHCGFKDTEIKGGGAITQQGRRDTLLVVDAKVDLIRDIIKSDTAGITIPELGLELTRGSLGGMYTSVEGVMLKMKENLFSNRFFQGDSQDKERVSRFDQLERDFDDCMSGKKPFTLILEDPLANSYIYSPYDPPSSDPRLVVETYDRSWDEDEELGLHDMVVDPVEYLPVDDSNMAEQVFSHLQNNQPDTHPGKYAQGGSGGEL